MEAKRIAAERAVDYVEAGMIVGLGTGSTAYWAIQKLGRRVQSGLRIHATATSNESERLARELGIPLIPLSEISEIDVTIDGADEVDPDLNLIKGGGGALLREKIIASSSKRFIVVVDESKAVERLGKFHLPVEVVPFGYELTMRKLRKLDCMPVLRKKGHELYVTDNGNYIADCDFKVIDDAPRLEREMNMIPGVVENGLFIRMANRVIVGHTDGSVKEIDT